MKKYRIEFSYQLTEECRVEGEDDKEAIERFLKGDYSECKTLVQGRPTILKVEVVDE